MPTTMPMMGVRRFASRAFLSRLDCPRSGTPVSSARLKRFRRWVMFAGIRWLGNLRRDLSLFVNRGILRCLKGSRSRRRARAYVQALRLIPGKLYRIYLAFFPSRPSFSFHGPRVCSSSSNAVSAHLNRRPIASLACRVVNQHNHCSLKPVERNPRAVSCGQVCHCLHPTAMCSSDLDIFWDVLQSATGDARSLYGVVHCIRILVPACQVRGISKISGETASLGA